MTLYQHVWRDSRPTNHIRRPSREAGAGLAMSRNVGRMHQAKKELKRIICKLLSRFAKVPERSILRQVFWCEAEVEHPVRVPQIDRYTFIRRG